MIERIRQLMEYSGLSGSQFADEIEVPRAILSHIMSGRNRASLDVILKVAAKFTDVNLDWLLLGKGEMLKQVASDIASEPAKTHSIADIAQTAKTINEVGYKPDKVQQDHTAENSESGNSAVGKQVKQIVFFYTDNSFSIFNPEV